MDLRKEIFSQLGIQNFQVRQSRKGIGSDISDFVIIKFSKVKNKVTNLIIIISNAVVAINNNLINDSIHLGQQM